MVAAVNLRNHCEDLDVTPEEAIPALVAAIALVAMDTTDPARALDEASDLLAEVQPQPEEDQ